MGTYGENQVDLFSGVPSINLPIYTISCRDYALPVSLNYDASGVKVNQEANWVGLGWNLSAGSPISRVVRGGDDFIASNGTDNPANYINLTPVSDSWLQTDRNKPCATDYTGIGGVGVKNYFNNEKDLQHDIFIVNIAGRTIKFILNTNRTGVRYAKLLVKEKVRIRLLYSQNYAVPGFEITTEDGTRYYYGENYAQGSIIGSPGPYTNTTNFTEVLQIDMRKWTPGAPAPSWWNQAGTPPSNGGHYIQQTEKVATAWHLRKIITPLGDEINYTYDVYTQISPYTPTFMITLPAFRITSPIRSQQWRNLRHNRFAGLKTLHFHWAK